MAPLQGSPSQRPCVPQMTGSPGTASTFSHHRPSTSSTTEESDEATTPISDYSSANTRGYSALDAGSSLLHPSDSQNPAWTTSNSALINTNGKQHPPAEGFDHIASANVPTITSAVSLPLRFMSPALFSSSATSPRPPSSTTTLDPCETNEQDDDDDDIGVRLRQLNDFVATNGQTVPPSLTSNRQTGNTSDVSETERYLRLVNVVPEAGETGNDDDNVKHSAKHQEIRTAPLFSHQVRNALQRGKLKGYLAGLEDAFPQYGLLGIREETRGRKDQHVEDCAKLTPEQNLVFANMNAPWSALICGSQGSGKSHTLSCLLENSLLSSSPAGILPNPLAGLVFHYDKYTSHASTQVCEAAYLCSAGIPVRVLVSPSNIHNMHHLYTNLAGLPKNAPRPQVLPLYFREDQLNVSRMVALMAVNDGSQNKTPLYIEVLYKILRDMASEAKGAPGLNYMDFRRRLLSENFTPNQIAPLQLRLGLLESFLAHPTQEASLASSSAGNIFRSDQGTLTIVDLSCPFVNENDACSLFTMCLSLFMENRGEGGRIVALDEAHKFLTKSGEAERFTGHLTSIVCQQRHLATRIVVATQEPTLSPRLLDLCNITMVHRFNSPAWFEVLRGHLAGATMNSRNKADAWEELFGTIVGLQTGEALVFCPSAVMDVSDGDVDRLKEAYIKMRVRSRVTADGGRSIMADAKLQPTDVDSLPLPNFIRPFSVVDGELKARGKSDKSSSNGKQTTPEQLPEPPRIPDGSQARPKAIGKSPEQSRKQHTAPPRSKAIEKSPEQSRKQHTAPPRSKAIEKSPEQSRKQHTTPPPSKEPAVSGERSTMPSQAKSSATLTQAKTKREQARNAIKDSDLEAALRRTTSSHLQKNSQNTSHNQIRKETAISFDLEENFFTQPEGGWKRRSATIITGEIVKFDKLQSGATNLS